MNSFATGAYTTCKYLIRDFKRIANHNFHTQLRLQKISGTDVKCNKTSEFLAARAPAFAMKMSVLCVRPSVTLVSHAS